MIRGARWVWLAAVAAACGGGGPAAAAQVTPTPSDTTRDPRGLPPAGYGTLRRDDVAVRLATDQVQITVLPLDERVTRLLATDTYNSFQQLLQSKRAELDAAAARAGATRPTLVFVQFFGINPGARFDPQQLYLSSRGRFYRSLDVVPLTPRWNEQQLGPREQQAAIYLFEEGIPFTEPLTVTYTTVSSEQWTRSLDRLERERAQVYARAGSPTPPP
jgi:hypothetical protein